ncbi:MAG TPA: hypothetical protein VM428_09725 [Microlunatus sp.]|jgi:integrase|nr:hypothetical protein [Microlunatus sp.]
MQAAITSHENGQLSRTKSRAVTVAMMAEAHAAHPDARVPASTLKADTRDWYVRLLRIHVVGPHRAAKVADIRPSTVEAWISAEPQLSGSTRRGVYLAFRGALEVMVKEKVIPTNPAKEVTGPRANSRSPEPAESLDVEKMLKVASDEMRLAIEVLALTGIRRAELLTIQWKQVNLVDDRLTVRTAKQRAGSPVKTSCPADPWPTA